MHYNEAFTGYRPEGEQEIIDRRAILELISEHGDALLTRDSEHWHLTASGFIVNEACTHVLMVYHNIYKSWSWTGGHADGEDDLLSVAMREAQEETGAEVISPLPEAISLDILPVCAHFKRGKYVLPHMHLNLTYLLIAKEDAALAVKPDENSGVKWIAFEDLPREVSEPPMLVIYNKIIERIKNYQRNCFLVAGE